LSKVEVTNVQIKVGQNKFNLTIKEAMELKKVLNDIFPDKEFVSIHHAPYIPQTIYIERPYRRWNDWEITWCEQTDKGTGGTLMLNNTYNEITTAQVD